MYGAHDSISSNNENFYSSIRYRLSNYIIKLKTALCSYLLNLEENLEKNFKILKKALLRQNRQKKKKSRINFAINYEIFNFQNQKDLLEQTNELYDNINQAQRNI